MPKFLVSLVIALAAVGALVWIWGMIIKWLANHFLSVTI